MVFNVTKLPDKPVVVFEPEERFRLIKTLPKMIEDVTRVLDTLDTPVYYISDMRRAEISLDDIFLGMTQVVLGERPFLRHENIREVLIITANPMIKRIARGIGSGLYGEITVKVFPDRETALAYVDQQTGHIAPPPQF